MNPKNKNTGAEFEKDVDDLYSVPPLKEEPEEKEPTEEKDEKR